MVCRLRSKRCERTADPATDPAGTAGGESEENVLDGTEATKPGDVGGGGNARGPQFGGEAESGCNVSHSSSSTPFGALGLALAGVLALVRRNKKSEEN